jgi:CRISPR-associated protein Cmr2
MTKTLFTFTFSPVQEFIIEARRGQDLFTGSHILSQLAESVIMALVNAGAAMIYPALPNTGDAPNRLLATLDGVSAPKAAEIAEKALRTKWSGYVDAAGSVCASWAVGTKSSTLWRQTWDRQAPGPWSCFWAAAPYAPGTDGGYQRALQRVSWLLDSDKRTRLFDQSLEPGMKDTLSGSRSALSTESVKDARTFWSEAHHIGGLTRAKLRPSGRERLDLIGVVKRFALTDAELPRILSTSSVATEDYLEKAIQVANTELEAYAKAVRKLMGAAYFRARAERGPWHHDGDWFFPESLTASRLQREYDIDADHAEARECLETLQKKIGKPCAYFAVVSIDGDNMGARLSTLTSPEEHTKFSQQVTSFAAEVAGIVNQHQGQKVYAGADDVLALFPLATAISGTRELLELFKSKTGNTASAGIAIGHHFAPLDQLLEQSRSAEKDAKKSPGKNAISVTIDKRSGAPHKLCLPVKHFEEFGAFVAAFSLEGQPAVSGKFAGDARALAERFQTVSGGFNAISDLNAAYRSMVRYELSQHIKHGADGEKVLFQRIDQLLDATNIPLKFGDALLAARFIASRGLE